MTFDTNNTPESTANFVQNRWAYFREHADELLGYAVNGAFAIGSPVLSYNPRSINVGLNVNPEYGTFARPTPPTPPTFLDINVTVPTAPALTPVVTPSVGVAPTEPDLAPFTSFQLPGTEPVKPPVPSDLDTPVTLDVVTVPTFVEPTLPELAALYAITLPAIPSITIAPFAGVRPTFTATVPDNTFNFTDTTYTSALLEQMRTKLGSIITGGTGLPVAVENSLFEQARSRDSRAARRLRTSVSDEMGSRGLNEPTGLLAARLREIEQDVQDKASDTSREIFIQRYTKEIEQLNFAIQQGSALEGVLIQQQIASNDRRLRAAQIAVEVAINLFNAQVSLFNANVQAYTTDAEVFRDRIQGELAKVELYKAQVDGQKAIGDLNESLVRSYAEKVRAVISLAELYRTRVDAARAQLEVNAQRLEAKRVQVQTYSERVRGYGVEWDGYKAQVEGRLGSLRAGEILVNMYGQRVQAFTAKQNGAFEGARLLFAGEQLKSEQYKTVLDQVRAQLAVQLANNEARGRSFEAQAGVYTAEGRMIESEANVKNQVALAKVALAEANANIEVKNADAQINQAIKLLDASIEGTKGKATVLAQLASSVLSGFNFGAQLTASSSDSYSYDKSVGVSYSGTGPPITFAIGGI